MVAGHRHGDLRGRAMESRRNVRQEPYAITAHGPRKVWVESWKHGLPRCSGKGATECNICLPRHRPPFPHAQHEPLIPSPQNPADRNAARDRKRKYVICRAVLRKPTWTRGEKKKRVETMATFFLARADSLSIPTCPHSVPRLGHYTWQSKMLVCLVTQNFLAFSWGRQRSAPEVRPILYPLVLLSL